MDFDLLHKLDLLVSVDHGELFGRVLRNEVFIGNSRLLKLVFGLCGSLVGCVPGFSLALQRNVIIYGAGSGMSWHTNGDVPGVRCYIVYNGVGGSCFRWQ